MKKKLVLIISVIVIIILSGTYALFNFGAHLMKKPERSYPVFTYMERWQQLSEFSEYKDDNRKIPFTYELNQKEKYKELINKYDLDSVVKWYEDVELMKVLLNWFCDNFKHNGSTGLPSKHDAITLTNHYKKHPDGINCRGVSIILAEILRAYGVPAKHITCMPKEAVFDDCHVVVHAYSKKLNQWIMLDPTYRLILQNSKGDYINLPMLREALINKDELIPNTNAGHNGEAFDINDYCEYMTKNTFRFMCATDYYFGAEEGVGKNRKNILVPVNYSDDISKSNTTSDKAFWALP